MRINKKKFLVLLESKGLTQAELARRLGYERRQVNFWFNGVISYKRAVRVCDYLGVLINDYIDFEDFYIDVDKLSEEERRFLQEELEQDEDESDDSEDYWDDF